MRHKWVTAIFGTLLAGPSAGFALCLTEDGLPASSLAPIVETALTAHQDGSARYVHLLEITDFNADGLLDMILAVKDESYSGAPVFDLSYFQGTNEGWCGTAVASGLAALNSDVNVSITPAVKTGGAPTSPFTSPRLISLRIRQWMRFLRIATTMSPNNFNRRLAPPRIDLVSISVSTMGRSRRALQTAMALGHKYRDIDVHSSGYPQVNELTLSWQTPRRRASRESPR